jgi:hypothetical protein
MKNSANTESRVTRNLANTESQVTKNWANTENQVMQDSGGGGREPEEGKGAAPRKRQAPWWCPRGITKTQKHRLQKMRQREEERDYWFNYLWPMTKLKQMWREKWLGKEENSSNSDSSGKEEVEVTSDKGGSYPKSCNGNPASGNGSPGDEEDWREEKLTWMNVNMVFTISVGFCAPAEDVAELTQGAGCAVVEKLENLGAYMKPLFI